MQRKDLIDQLDGTEIAVIGMACHLPGANDANTFWDNLKNGKESITFFTDEELLEAGVPPEQLRRASYVKAKGKLEGVENFDAGFFGFSPRDAAIMDPQHRHFLECAWEALEVAGYDSERYEGSIGVFAGVGMNTYFIHNLMTNTDLIRSHGMFAIRHTSNDKDFLATRVSYNMNLKGPSVSVQTACSTSLVAIHMSCQSLLNGESDMVLAGGATFDLPQDAGYHYKEGEILSHDGHCRAFDADSTGTVLGNGVGVVVLKRLEDAIQDGDTVHAMVRASAINNDGSLKVSYLAPSVEGQAAVYTEAYAVGDINPETISYVEAHGTGTLVGDPIEVTALTQAFRMYTEKKNFCGLGSVKSNIGHLDTAAGVAAFIKVVMALKHRQIPPSLNFRRPNPALQLEESPFYIVDSLKEWEKGDTPRRAAVSSLGVGGTNAHVVVEESPELPPSKQVRDWQLFVLSARSRQAVDQAASNLSQFLQKNDPILDDVAYTLAVGRKQFKHRRVVVARNREQAIEFLENNDKNHTFYRQLNTDQRPGVVFMFPGGGAQYANMGRELYDAEPIYRDVIDTCLGFYQRNEGSDLRHILFPDEEKTAYATEQMASPSLALPALFMTEYALAKLWMSYGIEPIAMTGHSMGEYTAACIAGVMTIEEALMLVTLRGKLFETLPKGSMLSVMLSEEKLLPLLGSDLSIAAINAPELCVASGPDAAIDALQLKLEEEEIDCRRIHISVAAHSSMVEQILDEFRKTVRTLKLQPPQRAFLSNVTGTWITDEQATDAEYWVQHIRKPVRFAQGLGTILKDHHCVLLEVGPGKGLGSLAQMHNEIKKDTGIVTSLRHPKEVVSDAAFYVRAIGQLWANEVMIDWSNLYKPEERYRIPLPTYPFEHQRYWIEPRTSVFSESEQTESLVKKADISDWFYKPVWKEVPLIIMEGDSSAPPENYLVFKDRLGYGTKVTNYLRSKGHNVITVRPGRNFSFERENDLQLNIRSFNDYELLVAHLLEIGFRPNHVLHLWSVNHHSKGKVGLRFLDKHLDLGFNSLFFLARAFADESMLDDPLQIIVFSNDMHRVNGKEFLSPEKASLLGPCRVIPLEYPNVVVKSIDLNIPTLKRKKILPKIFPSLNNIRWRFILDEIKAINGENVAVYRDGKRWIREYEKVSISEAQSVPSHLRDEGVYIITGGLGGIGLTISDYLAHQVKAKLILLTRQEFPQREEWNIWLKSKGKEEKICQQILRILALESHGAEVVVETCDVTRLGDVKRLITNIKSKFGEVNGLFHAAGVISDNLIQSKSELEVARVLGPKVTGTLVLDQLLSNEKLDLLVLFSSTSSFLASAGQVDYAAANAFLNAFAEYKGMSSSTRTVAINWGMWKQVGMAAEIAGQLGVVEKQSVAGKPAQNPLLDEIILDSDKDRVFSSTFDSTTHWVLDEHRLASGHSVLPGTAYIELVAESFLEGKKFRPISIEELYFLNPLEVQDKVEKEVQIILEGGESGLNVVVKSTSRKGAGSHGSTEHANCSVNYLSEEHTSSEKDIEELKERCSLENRKFEQSGKELKQSAHLQFGPRWDCLSQVFVGKNEILGELDLAEKFESDLSEYICHPALLDMATGLGLILLEEHITETTFYVPLGYQNTQVLAPIPAKLYSHVRFSEGGSLNTEAPVFDVSLMDESGKVVLEIRQFTMRKVTSSMFQSGETMSEMDLDLASRGDGAPAAWSSDEPTLLEIGMQEGILPEEGQNVMHRILGGKTSSQIVATSLGLNPLRAFIEKSSLDNDAAGDGFQANRPNLSSEFVEPATPLETELAKYWEELIGIDKIGVHDDFFELGGHSLIALRFFSRLKKNYGADLSLAILFEYPNVASFAKMLKSEMGVEVEKNDKGKPNKRVLLSREWSPVVPIQAKGSKTPLFCVHALFGNVMDYYALSKYLGESQPIYGLQAQGTDGKKMALRSFEEMAKLYINEMKKVQPLGPYMICGTSIGGEIAFEIAQQLKADENEVSFLGMFDTLEPGFARRRNNKKKIIEARDDADAMARRNKSKGNKSSIKKNLFKLTSGVITRLSPFLCKILLFFEVVIPQVLIRHMLINAGEKALQNYNHKKYPGKLTLFRATKTKSWGNGGSSLTWESLTGGEYKIILIEGQHGFLREPFVGVLAGLLKAALSEATNQVAKN